MRFSIKKEVANHIVAKFCSSFAPKNGGFMGKVELHPGAAGGTWAFRSVAILIFLSLAVAYCSDDAPLDKCVKECCVVDVGEKKVINGETNTKGDTVCYELRLEPDLWHKIGLKDLTLDGDVDVEDYYYFEKTEFEPNESYPWDDLKSYEFISCNSNQLLYSYVRPVPFDHEDSFEIYPQNPFRLTIEQFPGYNDGYVDCKKNLGDPPIYKFAGRVGYYWAKVENTSFYTFNNIEGHYYLITIENSSGEYEIKVGTELIKVIETGDLKSKKFIMQPEKQDFIVVTDIESGITYEISIEDLGTTPP